MLLKIKVVMAKDKNDNKTIDALTLRRGVSGRPKTDTAMTPAQKQAKYRSRKELVNLSVMISADEKAIVDRWVKNGNTTLSDVISTMIRLAAY